VVRDRPGVSEQQPALDLYPDKETSTELPGIWIRTPHEHGQLVHGGGKGLVAVAHKTGTECWKERVQGVEAALEMLRYCRGQENVYLSTQRFRGRRRVAYLLSLSELYADLDYYRVPELAGAGPRKVLKLALEALRKAGIPEPSLAISSGRGLYLLWLHEPIARSALPRWAACQKQICKTLKHLGADGLAVDAARVLRVIGTRHSTAGAMVEAITPASGVWEFDRLADRILPLARAELHDLRVQRALRAARSPSERQQAPPEGFTAATLWEARLSDLQRLKEMRWFGEPMPDFRDRWLFVAGVGMSWLAIPPVLQRELFALAREVGGWTEGNTRSKLHAVFRTAREAAAGKRVEFAGVEWDPRYRLRNQTIIEWLQITTEEEREMKTIVSDDERRLRDRARKNPEMTRTEYETRAARRRAQARRMAAEGLRPEEIAETLGVSIHSVRSYLYRDV
jgi:hypothetical protein